MIQFDFRIYFSNGLGNQPPTYNVFKKTSKVVIVTPLKYCFELFRLQAKVPIVSRGSFLGPKVGITVAYSFHPAVFFPHVPKRSLYDLRFLNQNKNMNTSCDAIRIYPKNPWTLQWKGLNLYRVQVLKIAPFEGSGPLG